MENYNEWLGRTIMKEWGEKNPERARKVKRCYELMHKDNLTIDEQKELDNLKQEIPEDWKKRLKV